MKLRLAALLLLPLSCAALADEGPAPYVSVLGSYLRADYPGVTANGYGIAPIVGLPLTSYLNLELGGFANRVSGRVPGTDYIYGLGGDIQAFLSNGSISYFALAGVGADIDDVADTTRAAPYVDVGAGLLVKLAKHWALRAEGRYYAVFNVDKGSSAQNAVVNDVRFNAGLQYSFGAVIPSNYPFQKHAAAATPEVEPVPATVLEPQPAPEIASINIDTDGDGVPDSKDQCPDTPKGLKVDAIGCIIEQTVVLRAVNFDFGADVLSAEAKSTLDLLARSMVLQKALIIEIAGHTDSLGPQSFNLLLSQKRAAAVKDYLVAHGVEADRLQSEGYGEFNPIADNNTEAGRALNRRVEFKVLNKPAK